MLWLLIISFSFSKRPFFTWKIIDIAPVQKEVSVHGVAYGWKPVCQRHGASDVTPQRAVVVDPHLGVRDVRRHREKG